MSAPVRHLPALVPCVVLSALGTLASAAATPSGSVVGVMIANARTGRVELGTGSSERALDYAMGQCRYWENTKEDKQACALLATCTKPGYFGVAGWRTGDRSFEFVTECGRASHAEAKAALTAACKASCTPHVDSFVGAAPTGSPTASGSASRAAPSATTTASAGSAPRADVMFAKGTRVVRFHLTDPYTYAENRHVYVNLAVPGTTLGWGTWVYPNQKSSPANPPFFFGAPSGAVVPSVGGPSVTVPGGAPLKDGDRWSLKISCTKAETKDFWGFSGLDGTLEIETPVKRTVTFKVGVGATTELRFGVEP
jgi:hypothetical protein